jgi:hypothetical protein
MAMNNGADVFHCALFCRLDQLLEVTHRRNSIRKSDGFGRGTPARLIMAPPSPCVVAAARCFHSDLNLQPDREQCLARRLLLMIRQRSRGRVRPREPIDWPTLRHAFYWRQWVRS